jgi:hypothetical protein
MDSPLRSITQRDYKLQTHNQNTSIAQNNEDVFAHVVTERIKLFIGQRASNEVESEVEVGLEKVSGRPKRKRKDKLTRPK